MSDDLVKRARHNALADMPHYASVELIEAMADRIEELSNCVAVLEAKLRKSALKKLSALGQATEAYQAQLAAEARIVDTEAKLAKAVEALGTLAYCVDDGCYCSER